MSMDWIQKHRNKVLFAALAATGVYGASRYLFKLLTERRSNEVSLNFQLKSNRLLEAHGKHHETTVSAVQSLLPRLRDVLDMQLNTSALTDQLKAKPANKVALWEELKSLSFARLMADVYSSTLLASFMSVQLSILGGFMLYKGPVVSGDTHKCYLSMVEYLLGEGVLTLSASVRRAAQEVLAGYSLKQGLTCQHLEQLLTDLRHSARDHSVRSRRCFLVAFVLPPESLISKSQADNSDLGAAIRDIVESAQFSEVLEACLEVAFRALAAGLSHSYHTASQNQTVLPLARLIPMVTDHAACDTQLTSTALAVLEDIKLLTLSNNVYESFSQL